VSYHAPHDWSVKFTGTCRGVNTIVNGEACPLVMRDDTEEEHACSVDLLERLESNC
jgi:hypothetical protein